MKIVGDYKGIHFTNSLCEEGYIQFYIPKKDGYNMEFLFVKEGTTVEEAKNCIDEFLSKKGGRRKGIKK